MRLRLTASLAALGAWLGAAPTALADRGEKVGENVGDLLSGWARPLYLGIAAIIALVFLVNRRFGELAVFLVAAVVVGGFVLAPASVAATVHDIWSSVTGSG
jgi:hypothetical protein